jgi:hypothetical protein
VRSRGVPKHRSQGFTVGGDVVRVRADRPTAAEAGSMDGCGQLFRTRLLPSSSLAAAVKPKPVSCLKRSSASSTCLRSASFRRRRPNSTKSACGDREEPGDRKALQGLFLVVEYGDLRYAARASRSPVSLLSDIYLGRVHSPDRIRGHADRLPRDWADGSARRNDSAQHLDGLGSAQNPFYFMGSPVANRPNHSRFGRLGLLSSSSSRSGEMLYTLRTKILAVLLPDRTSPSCAGS